MRLHWAVVSIGLALAGCAGKKTALAPAQAADPSRAAEPAHAAVPPADAAAAPIAFAPDGPGGAEEALRPGCTPIGGEPPTCQ